MKFMAKLYKPFNLTFPILAYPEDVMFTWKTGNIVIKDKNKMLNTMSTHFSSTLFITNFTLQHVKNYSVTATNGVKPDLVYTFQIIQEGKNLNITKIIVKLSKNVD